MIDLKKNFLRNLVTVWFQRSLGQNSNSTNWRSPKFWWNEVPCDCEMQGGARGRKNLLPETGKIHAVCWNILCRTQNWGIYISFWIRGATVPQKMEGNRLQDYGNRKRGHKEVCRFLIFNKLEKLLHSILFYFMDKNEIISNVTPHKKWYISRVLF